MVVYTIRKLEWKNPKKKNTNQIKNATFNYPKQLTPF